MKASGLISSIDIKTSFSLSWKRGYVHASRYIECCGCCEDVCSHRDALSSEPSAADRPEAEEIKPLIEIATSLRVAGNNREDCREPIA
jgi:hypothetical protein